MVLARNRFYRVVLWLLVGCTLYVMTKTQSRGGMLGVLVFCLVYFLLRIARHLSKQSKALFVSTLILILVSFLVFILALDSYFSARYIMTLSRPKTESTCGIKHLTYLLSLTCLA